MIAYNGDFALMLIVILVSLPLLLLVRTPRRAPLPAAVDDLPEPLFSANLPQRQSLMEAMADLPAIFLTSELWRAIFLCRAV